jgi:fatty-acyl-CoA synthase/long-chain acyl-CoA synthetase
LIRDGFDAGEVLERSTVSASLSRFWCLPLLDLLVGRPSYESTLRTVVYGAAPIAPGRLSEAINRFGQVFIQQYGQAEAIIWGTRLSKLDHDVTRPHLLESCGRPSILADSRSWTTRTSNFPTGEVGEVCLLTRYNVREYLKNADATADKMVNGFVRTGDLGLIDDLGYVFLKDRKGDVVTTGGLNVYAATLRTP